MDLFTVTILLFVLSLFYLVPLFMILRLYKLACKALKLYISSYNEE